jgi:predicted transcriptional regulator
VLTTNKIAKERGVTPQRVRQVLAAARVKPVEWIGQAAIWRPEDVERAFKSVKPGGLGWRKGKRHES